MYQQLSNICSEQKGASGPAIGPDHVLTNPILQQECIDHILTNGSRRQFPRYVNKVMDLLGYSYGMIKERQKAKDECDKLTNRFLTYCRVTTGGKGEGTTLPYESDTDYMHIISDVICTDHPQSILEQRNMTVFHIQRQETSPGYTRLKLLRLDKKHNFIRESLFESETGSYYMSSTFCTDARKINVQKVSMNKEIAAGHTSGPSTPYYTKHISVDSVLSFRCICPDILERWLSRRRHHGWPTPESIREISRLDGHVVPVGFKGSDNAYKEWRICYSLAELHLMRNLNETQLKVYILLKKLAKSVLNPVCQDMTSYTMKNVVLWMCEANGINRFTPDTLLDRLFDCIRYLQKCVSDKVLPSYMIPERNLFAGRLDIPQRHQLTCLLGDLLHEGERMLLRSDKLRDAMIIMYATPEMFREFAQKRDQVESLLVIQETIIAETYRPGMTPDETKRLVIQNEQFCDISRHIVYLIRFDRQALIRIGRTSEEISDLYDTRLSHLLS